MSAARVLVCDDEPGIRQTLGQILGDEGYAVETRGSARRPIQRTLSDETPPDAVFLDVWLPDVDGLTVLDRLRAGGFAGPVLMISGHGTVETAVAAVKRGADDFLEKPLALERVLLTLEKALERSRLARERDDLRRELASRDARAAEEEVLLGEGPAMTRLDVRDRARGRLGRARPHHGRERDGQGARRARPPPGLAARRGPVRRGERRGDPRGAHRERALRAREGLVHGRVRGPQGQVGAGGRRDALPRRDRRHVGAHAGEDPPRDPGREDHARRRRRRRSRRTCGSSRRRTATSPR